MHISVGDRVEMPVHGWMGKDAADSGQPPKPFHPRPVHSSFNSFTPGAYGCRRRPSMVPTTLRTVGSSVHSRSIFRTALITVE